MSVICFLQIEVQGCSMPPIPSCSIAAVGKEEGKDESLLTIPRTGRKRASHSYSSRGYIGEFRVKNSINQVAYMSNTQFLLLNDIYKRLNNRFNARYP